MIPRRDCGLLFSLLSSPPQMRWSHERDRPTTRRQGDNVPTSAYGGKRSCSAQKISFWTSPQISQSKAERIKDPKMF
jgi:hypothetical protein